MAVVDGAAVTIGLNVSFQISVFSQFVSRSGITGSYVGSIFSFLRNLHTVLHRGFNTFHSHPQCREGFFFFIFSPAFIICRLKILCLDFIFLLDFAFFFLKRILKKNVKATHRSSFSHCLNCSYFF